MVDARQRREQLLRLERALTSLIALLLQDSGNPWTAHFEDARERARAVLAAPVLGQDALTKLATSITSLFDPKDAGFDAYWPAAIAADQLTRMRQAVYDAAFELRVVERY